MASAVKHKRTERGEASCFSRAARRIRGVLSRICRDNSEEQVYINARPTPRDPIRGRPKPAPDDPFIYTGSQNTYATLKRRVDDHYERLPIRRNRARFREDVYDTLTRRDDDHSERLPHPGSIKQNTKCLPWFKSPPLAVFPRRVSDRVSVNDMTLGSDANRENAHLYYQRYQLRRRTKRDFTVCTEKGSVQDAFQHLSVQPKNKPEGDSDALVETEALVTAVNSSVTNTPLPTQGHLHSSSSGPGLRGRGSSCLPRSDSVPLLSQIKSAKNKTLTRSESLPDMMLKTSYEEFTPDITDEENDESYSFQCSRPGLYQCSVTDLLFHMEGEGVVVYRIVPWNRRLLAQYHKKPAGPLFDIKCVQKSVCQLHLPHCEISSTGGCHFLSVAHVNDEGIEFITPHKITETHVIINISGFSGFGNVKDEDSPPVPVRALVLLFYRPPTDPDPESLINVLLLPKNVSLRDVQRTRKKLVGDERYIETSPHCKLQPDQFYTLSTGPEDDSVLVQPAEAEFDCDNYDNFFPSFQVILEKVMKHMKLFLRDSDSSHSVWERQVCLSSAGVKRSCGQSPLNLPPNQRLLDTRSSFIDGISGPVLKTLLDKLLEKRVITDSERESVNEMQGRRDKACFVIDTVRKKGEAASSEMIEFLCEVDPFLCEHLGLI